MSTLLSKIIADFRTTLATELAVGGTSVTLQSATDDDGIALPSGQYFFTIDGDSSQKEHITCALVGTALTSIKSVSRQGVQTAGVVRKHRVGASVTITDFAHIKYINDLLLGTTDLNSATPLKYDGAATISNSAHLATKAYVDGVAVAGAPDMTVTVKGIAEEATQAEIDADTGAGGTGARLAVNPSTLVTSKYGRSANAFVGYAADAGGSDTYAITLSPALSAYATGQAVTFKANTRNTGAATLNVNALGAKTIKKDVDQDLATGDIKAGQLVTVVYDGTNMQMVSTTGPSPTGSIIAFGASSAPSGYLLCDGSAVSRTTYAALFAVVSTTFGVGDGATTFNVPNLKGRVIVGFDAAQTEFDAMGETGGAKTHTLTEAEMPAHVHTIPDTSGGGGFSRVFPGQSNNANVTTNSGSTGGGGAHNNLQPYLTLNYIIKI